MSNSRMPVVYVAGPYRGLNRDAVELNIQVARAVGLEAVRKGWSPLIPHANSGHLDALINLPDQFWLDATLELMRRCDAVVLCPGWARSAGTEGEIREARRIGLPIYANDNDLPTAERFLEKYRIAG